MRTLYKKLIGLSLFFILTGGVLLFYQLHKPLRTNVPDRMNSQQIQEKRKKKLFISPRARELPGKIVFSSNHDNHYRIYLLVQGRLTQITKDTSPASYPRLSPNGRFIVYQQKIKNQWDLFLYNIPNKTRKRLTHSQAHEENPSWSHDGRYIYFDSDASGTRQIFRIHLRSGNIEQVTHSKLAKNILPAVSPYSPYTIALTTSRWWGWSVGILDLKTQKAQIIQKGEACRPAWNPVQPYLVYVSMKWDGKGDIALYDIKSKKLHNLTPDRPDTYDYDPVWSPDGQFILFQSTRDKKHGNWDIYLLNPSQGKWVRLIGGPGQQIYPHWSK